MFKKIHLTLLFSLIHLHLFSQDYIPILKEGSFWDIKTSVITNLCTYSDIESIKRIQIDGDTIINNKTYKKLKSVSLEDSDSSDSCFLPPLYFNSNNFTSIKNRYLREDNNDKKLYILTNMIDNSFKEYTVCDFNLNIGDTLENYFGFNNSEHKLIVDDIKIDAQNRKVFYINDGSYYTEGIGRNEGNLNIYLNLIDGTFDRLYCWGNSENLNNCATVLSTDQHLLSSIKIYPNPVNDVLHIENTEEITLKIYTTTGKLLKNTTSKKDLKIDISSYKKGIYILEISTTTSQKTSKILIN